MDQNLAAGGTLIGEDQLKQGALPGTARAGNEDKIPLGNMEVGVLKG